MCEPSPIFDPAAWCETWLQHGGSISWNGHVEQPLAYLIGSITAREDCLCALYRRIADAPLHREAVRRFWRSDAAGSNRVRATRNAWRSGHG